MVIVLYYVTSYYYYRRIMYTRVEKLLHFITPSSIYFLDRCKYVRTSLLPCRRLRLFFEGEIVVSFGFLSLAIDVAGHTIRFRFTNFFVFRSIPLWGCCYRPTIDFYFVVRVDKTRRVYGNRYEMVLWVLLKNVNHAPCVDRHSTFVRKRRIIMKYC